MPAPAISEIRLVNGSTGDPALYIDYPGKDNALLFDAGDNGTLDAKRLGDLEAVFITHHHVDHSSVSVFTSGVGGIRDLARGWMNVPLIFESLLGTLLWGLFIVAFSRKVIR